MLFTALHYNILQHHILYFSEIESDDAARALLTKDASSVPGQFDDAVENGGKGMEKGQGDAPLVTPVATES